MTDQALLATVLVALITAVIGPIVLEYIRSLIRKKEKDAEKADEADDPMYDEMLVDITITEQIQYLLDKVDADRVWVMQFHNGGHYYASGLSIKKFTIFFEVVSTGVSTIREKFVGIPTSFFSKSIKEVHDHSFLCVDDMNDESQPAYGLRDTAEGTGCQSLFMAALKTPSGKLHGAIGVEFVKEARAFTEDEKELIIDTASYISGALEVIHKFK